MTIPELYDTVKNLLLEIDKEYGDNVEYVEAYDGQIIIHFKSEYVEEEIANHFMRDFVQIVSKTIFGR